MRRMRLRPRDWTPVLAMSPLPPAPSPVPLWLGRCSVSLSLSREGGLANSSSRPGARASAGPPRTRPGHWLRHADGPGLRTWAARAEGPGSSEMSPPPPPHCLLCALLGGAPGPETARSPLLPGTWESGRTGLWSLSGSGSQAASSAPPGAAPAAGSPRGGRPGSLGIGCRPLPLTRPRLLLATHFPGGPPGWDVPCCSQAGRTPRCLPGPPCGFGQELRALAVPRLPGSQPL